jgi:hypothetical protein
MTKYEPEEDRLRAIAIEIATRLGTPKDGPAINPYSCWLLWADCLKAMLVRIERLEAETHAQGGRER